MALRCRGFSLIELVVAMVIFGVLLALGIPALTTYSQNLKLRSAAESFLAEVQRARGEAVRLNTDVVLTPVMDPDSPILIQELDVDNGVGIVPIVAISFTPFGARGDLITTGAVDFNFSYPSGGTCAPIPPATTPGPMRCLKVRVERGGRAKMCDPAATDAGDTRGCT